MISIFRKNKWQICYVDKIGTPTKNLIVTAKTMEQAKEKFRQGFNNKTIVKVMMIS